MPKSRTLRVKGKKTKYNTKNKRNNSRTRKNNSKKSLIIIGKIYSNMCGHCITLKPIWRDMKNKVKKMEKSHNCEFTFIEIEASKEHEGKSYVNNKYLQNNTSKLEIQGGYPTLFKIKGDKLSYYDPTTPRELNSLTEWCMSKN